MWERWWKWSKKLIYMNEMSHKNEVWTNDKCNLLMSFFGAKINWRWIKWNELMQIIWMNDDTKLVYERANDKMYGFKHTISIKAYAYQKHTHMTCNIQ